MANKADLKLRLATILLLEEGELSISDIAALPSVEDYDMARAIADELVKQFDAEIVQRRVESEVISQWDDFVLLKDPVTPKQLRSHRRE